MQKENRDEIKDLVVVNKSEIKDAVKDTLSLARCLAETELSEIDTGDEMQRRIRYQHYYTAIILIGMYKGDCKYKEIFCEHHEDILGVLENGKYHGIQVKTRQLSDGPFGLNDTAVKSSIKRFIELNEKFPNQFTKFIFVANCDFVKDKSGNDINHFVSQAKEYVSGNEFKPSTLEKFLKELETLTGIQREDIIKVVSMIELQLGPELQGIGLIAQSFLGLLPKCVGYSVEKVKIMFKHIVDLIYTASSKEIENPIMYYTALCEGSLIDTQKAFIINSKRVTKKHIKDIIESLPTKTYYLISANDNNIELLPDRQNRMKLKMAYGMIDPGDIESMDDLRVSAESYFFENNYKESSDSNIIKEFIHIKTLLLNMAREVKGRCKDNGAPYGDKMLRAIEQKIDEIIKSRPEDVFHYRYEILKGVIGYLTGGCKIAFSEEPKGGWKV